jgi:hypothetical protein
LSKFLFKQFSADARIKLKDYDESPTPDAHACLQATVISELNKILMGASIDRDDLFEGIELSPETMNLIATHPQGDALLRLNRLLLEQAYPLLIRRMTETKQSSSTAGPARRVDVNLADFENGSLRPAQLALFTPAVADTLILNQII